jgi:hypothetical protein
MRPTSFCHAWVSVTRKCNVLPGDTIILGQVFHFRRRLPDGLANHVHKQDKQTGSS